MARIDSYTAIDPTPDDYLLGTDNPGGGGITKNFTVQSIIDLTSESLGDTNDYLDGITVESGYAADSSDTATITFSVGSQTDVTLDLGGAAFKAVDHYATATALTNHINDTTQPHSLDSIVGSGTITTTKLSGNPGTGTTGQVLLSDGSGGFSWGNDQDDNDNYYLSSVTRPSTDSNDILFTITGGTNVTADVFSEGAFLSKTDIRADIKANHTFIASDFTFLGDIATKDKISAADINQNAIINSKIKDNTIEESKLNVTNDPINGYVLTAATDGAMTWVANSASNYYLNGISKSGNSLIFDVSGVSDDSPTTYTFGDGAFASFAGSNAGTFGTAGTVARSDHNHSISTLTDAGGLASKDSVNTSEILDKAVTAGKLSPSVAGTNGQVLALDSSLDLTWINSSGTTIADARLLPSTIGDTNSDEDDIGSQVLRVNSAGTLTEYVDLLVQRDEIDANGTPTSGKVLGLNSNNDLEWITTPSPTIGADSISPNNITIIADDTVSTTAGELLVSDGVEFSNVAMSGDATITSAGAISIEDGSITPDMRANSFFTKIPGDSWQASDGNWVTDAPYQKFTVDPTTNTSFNLPPLTSSETNPLVVITNGEYGIPYRFQVNVSGGSTNIRFAFEVPSVSANYTTYYKNDFGVDEYNDANPSNTTPAYIEVIFYKADIDLGGSTFYSTAEITSFNQPSILDNAVTHDKLGNEFKTKDATITLSASNLTANLDFRDHAIYEVLTPTDATNVTIKFNSAALGSTKLLLLKNQSTAGTGTITFATSDTSVNGVTFTATRLSSDDIVRTANTTNYIQITCIVDSNVDIDKRDFIYTVSQAQ